MTWIAGAASAARTSARLRHCEEGSANHANDTVLRRLRQRLHRVETVLRRKTSETSGRLRDADRCPSRRRSGDRVLGEDGLMRAVKGAESQVDDAGPQPDEIIGRARESIWLQRSKVAGAEPLKPVRRLGQGVGEVARELVGLILLEVGQ